MPQSTSTANRNRLLPWALFVVAFFYAFFFCSGIPLWDDDFTSWISKIEPRTFSSLFRELISPVSTQPQYWGFNERPLESLFYYLCYRISGLASWSYFGVKDLFFAGSSVMIYLWGLRLVVPGRRARWAAFAGALFFITAPGVVAAQIMLADFAPVAEFLFLLITYLIWGELERDSKKVLVSRWSMVLRWAGYVLVTYLAYKSKADLKLIPILLFVYLLSIDSLVSLCFTTYGENPGVPQKAGNHSKGLYLTSIKSKWHYLPVLCMGLLAIPWSRHVFSILPPFLPGSAGSPIPWMWQPPSFRRLCEFFWNREFYPFTVLGLFWPFLLLSLLICFACPGEIRFLFGARIKNFFDDVFDPRGYKKLSESLLRSPETRARFFVLIWLGVILIGMSSLAPINYFFRVRYEILVLVPLSMFLAWALSVQWNLKWRGSKLISMLISTLWVGLFSAQLVQNFYRSCAYRRSFGAVAVSVDRAYRTVEEKFYNDELVLLPDFLNYDFTVVAADVIRHRHSLAREDDLLKFTPHKTVVLSWNPPSRPDLELLERIPGCSPESWFDAVFPCAPDSGVYLMRYVGKK